MYEINNNGYNVLFDACCNLNPHIIDSILLHIKQGTFDDSLMYTNTHLNESLLHILAKCGLLINYFDAVYNNNIDYLCQKDAYGNDMLYYHIRRGDLINVPFIKKLLDLGLDPNHNSFNNVGNNELQLLLKEYRSFSFIKGTSTFD
jgi:hypothetical protein